ncbi:MAG: hypothetical protein ABJN14_11690 [Paracoccaceae bacterium]
MFVVGAGRVHADEVVEGDRIRNADLHELTVLSIEADTRPQIVHNLEIADAHTYFAGEFEAWGHNRKIRDAMIGALMQFGAVCGPLTDGLQNPTTPTSVKSGSGGGLSIGGSIDPSTPPKTPGPKLGPADRDKKKRECRRGTRRR